MNQRETLTEDLYLDVRGGGGSYSIVCYALVRPLLVPKIKTL